MRILLVADADDSWLKKYVEAVLLQFGCEVAVLTKKNNLFRAFYQNNNVQIHILPVKKRSRLYSLLADIAKKILPQSVKFFLQRQNMKIEYTNKHYNISNFDIIHFNYVDIYAEYLYSDLLKDYSGKIIMTYWGTDLFVNTKKRCNDTILRSAYAITFMSEGLKKYFQSIYGNDYNDKLNIIDFGVSVYDEIDKLSQEHDFHAMNRKHFKIPEGKRCLMAGYNARPRQRHLELIEAVDSLPEALKKNIHLLLQYSYGYDDDPEYYKKVKARLRRLSFSWGIIDELLDDSQTARLRDCVDIFLHAQPTDALSASMLEYLYAGAVVLNGAWLCYHELETLGIRYLRFADFSGLTKLLEDIINNYPAYKNDSLANRQPLYALNSWGTVKAKWLKLYE